MELKCSSCNAMCEFEVLSIKTTVEHSRGTPPLPLNTYDVICKKCNTADKIALISEINAMYKLVQKSANEV